MCKCWMFQCYIFWCQSEDSKDAYGITNAAVPIWDPGNKRPALRWLSVASLQAELVGGGVLEG